MRRSNVYPTSIDVPSQGGRSPRHSPQCSGRAHQRTHQLVRPRLWLSMMGLMIVVVMASRSKSRQKVEELSKVEKPQRLEKSAKAIGSEEPSFLTSDIRLATMENCWPWKSLRTASCKYKVLVRSYLYQANGATDALSHLFLRGARKIFEPRILESFAGCSPRWTTPMSRTSTSSSSLTLPHQVFVYKTHVIPLLNSGDVLRTKMSKPRIRPEMLDSWEDVEGIIKACLTFLKSSELSWLKGIMMRALWHRENSRTRC